jgi:hypothetical protein
MSVVATLPERLYAVAAHSAAPVDSLYRLTDKARFHSARGRAPVFWMLIAVVAIAVLELVSNAKTITA